MPGIATRQDWQAWAKGDKQPLIGDSPSVQEIPPMLRRRLSPLGKMALSVAWPILNENAHLPSVFCSRHGELERTVGMLKGLALEEALSPTHFSLSVHNAIGGVFSIARQDRSPISALAAGAEGLSQALLETRLILAEQEVPEALCVVYDAPLPGVYADFACEPTWPYAAAFLVSMPGQADSSHLPLSLALRDADDSSAASSPPPGQSEPQTLSFLRFLLEDTPEKLLLPRRRDFWQWSALEGRG